MLGLRRRLLQVHGKPQKSDTSLLAQFYYADVELCTVAAELDSFDGRKNPARCAALVAQLRQCQDKVLKLMQSMMDDVIKDERASRDFRVKYPEDLIQDGLAGQLWFGAECLAAGSSILNREIESESMRPMAKSLTKQLDLLRQLLRDQSIRDPLSFPDKIKAAFVKFDQTFADFELSYVSAMVPVKTMKEYDMSQEVTVLFSETVHRALGHGLITSDMLEYYDPVLMFTIPRLAIVTGLVIYPKGPLNPERKSADMSEMFRPFQSLLKRIRELLWSLRHEELKYLERYLCNLEEFPEKQSQISVNTECIVEQHKTENKPCQSVQHQFETLSPASTSLFNDISNLNDLPLNQISNANVVTDRSSIDSAILDTSVPQDNQSNGQLGDEPPSTHSDHQEAGAITVSPNNPLNNITRSPPSAVIINDPESGVARLRIVDSTQAPVTSDAEAVAAVSNVELVSFSDLKDDSHQTHQSEFAFNLPNSNQHSGVDDAEVSMAASVETLASGNTESGVGGRAPGRVTLHRAISQEPGTANAPLLGENVNQPYSDSSSDSSGMTPGYLSDMDSSSSSDEFEGQGDGQSRQAFRKLINTKSENLKKPHKNTEELIQRLFVCISGVADQLQSNFACDLRNILKCVFELHNSDPDLALSSDKQKLPTITTLPQAPPTWIPDSEMDNCCSCKLPFTLLRRRHHCRNCGLIFCGRCTANTAPLPHIGYNHAVRICNKCYVYRVNPFFMDTGEEPYNSTTSRVHS